MSDVISKPFGSVPNAGEKVSMRQRAELQAKAEAVNISLPLAAETALQMLHELRVHQIELEMQNEELRRTQQELEASCLRFFDLYELAPVGYLTVTDQGLIQMANLTAATLLGVERGALIKRPLSGFIFPEDQDIYYRHRQELLKTGVAQECELRLRKNDQTTSWVHLSITATEVDGGISGCRIALSEITARKQAEAGLQTRLALSLFADSHSLDELLQKTLDEVEVLTGSQIAFAHFVEADQKTLCLQMWSTNTLKNMCTAEGKGQHYAVDKGGVWTDCIATRAPVFHNDYGKLDHRKGLPPGHVPIRRELVVPVLRGDLIVMIVGVGNKATDYNDHDAELISQVASLAWDIVQRKRVETALRASEARLNLALHGADLGTWDWHIPSGTVTFNERWAGMIGYTLAELEPHVRVWETLIHPDDVAHVNSSLQAHLEGRTEAYETQHRLRHKLGKWIWVLDKGRVLERDAQGKPVRACGTHVDITELKQAAAEKENQEALDRHLQKVESLSRMAGAIAHHFNNQLHAVMMNLNLADDGRSQDGDWAEHLANAMQCTRDAAKVSILMLTYLGQTPCKRNPLDLSEVCQQHLTIVQIALPRNVMLETDFPAAGPIINADANQIQQVLNNLVVNASEALAGEGGNIHLAIRTVAPAEIPATHRRPINWEPQNTSYACLEVVDKGVGIAPQDMGKLGDPFFSNKFTGRGLGLSVVVGIMRTHHGVLTVESEPGRGSVFRVFLPMAVETVPQRPTRVCKMPPAFEGSMVLVVDDETMVRKGIMLALSRFGFIVLTAANGFEAVELFQQHMSKICLVLCDLTMPRMNGWETLAALRQLSPNIPVILSSGYSELHAMAGYHAELPQSFLSKPYVLEALRDTVAQVLDEVEGKRVK
jgi:PAS domain S-box-containing protein